MHNLSTKNFNLIPEDTYHQVLLLLLFAAIMFFIRTVPIHHLIFTTWPSTNGKFVGFAADDAVYHMRFVHNTLHHFPWRVFFDPFTHFPFGDRVHFGPLFTLIIATTSLLAGLGHPTYELINIIGAYTPAVMGVLCLIPIYFMARTLFGKTAAIITALILTFLPGEFLQRSTLGFADHHIAETLFSTITCAFFISALNVARNPNFTFKKVLNYGILTGISFGLFFLLWPGASIFGGIFLIFFIAQLIVDHLQNRPTTYLPILAITIYSIPAVMILPYGLMNSHLDLIGYSLAQPLILFIMATIFTISYVVHIWCRKNQLTKDLYSLILTGIFILIGFILYRYAPKFSTVIKDGCNLLFAPTPGMRTISELQPSIIHENKYTIAKLWDTYFWALLFATFGFGNLCYRAHQKAKPAEILLLTWTTIITLAAFAQCRFNYYLAINIAILAGCYCIYPFINFLGNANPQKLLYLKLQKIVVPTVFCIFTILTTYPMMILIINKKIPIGVQITHEQFTTYMWLKTHTPDPQGKVIDKNFTYASGYYPLPKNPSLHYKYPKSAYGIMSWWSIGHQLTYIAERIPNTNPFQSGIVEKNNTLGAAPFFITTSEEKAIKNLDTMGSRYILIDNKTAINMEGIGIWINDTEGWDTLINTKISLPPRTTKFQAPIDSPRFLQSMINRLYYNDTNGLEHFRLVHESDGEYLVTTRYIEFNPSLHTKKTSLPFKKYEDALKNVGMFNRGLWTSKEHKTLVYYARPPVKRIKIFEKVKGAVITGSVAKNIKNDSIINLTLKLKTKFNRIFTYKQTARITNGKYKFIVPYPTTTMRGDSYSYDIKPLGSYHLQIGPNITDIFVTEEAVMLGKNIEVSNDWLP